MVMAINPIVNLTFFYKIEHFCAKSFIYGAVGIFLRIIQKRWRMVCDYNRRDICFIFQCLFQKQPAFTMDLVIIIDCKLFLIISNYSKIGKTLLNNKLFLSEIWDHNVENTNFTPFMVFTVLFNKVTFALICSSNEPLLLKISEL